MRKALAPVGLLVVWSCSVNNNPATGGQDASAVRGPGVGAAYDAGKYDAGVCSGDAQAVCARVEPGCADDWANIAQAGCSPLRVCTCGGYDALFCIGTDTAQTSYYDHTTGKVVAVVQEDPVLGTTCIGPVSFAAPAGCTWPACEASDAGVDADAETVGVPACTQALAAGCTPYHPVQGNAVDFSNCPPTWDDAVAFCVMHAGEFGYAQTDCGTYLRWHVENGDVGCSYYYDKASGDLVAVFCAGTGPTTCLGGPLGLTEPACAPIQPQDYRPCVASDAGRDADATPSAD
jgi:hypothetical protein